MKKKVVALVPLRGGSKSIPYKNIKLIAGKPLCSWVLEAACDAIGPSNVFVSTEDDKIIETINSLRLGINIIRRPDEFATDDASTESVMLHFAEQVDFDLMITLQATSPLTSTNNIVKALETFERDQFDSLLTGVNCKRFFWKYDGTPINYNPESRPRRQDMRGWVMENGAFYLTKRQILEQHRSRLGGNIGIYEMLPETAIEIDEPEDWAVVEDCLIKEKRKKIKNLIQNIKLLVTDVDGTLTDAGMYYSANGEELKKFNTRDAQGLALIREKGLDVAIITKENSPIVQARARKLKIDECYIGIDDKPGCLENLCSKLNIAFSQVAYIGDDISDLECMGKVGFAACPVDAAQAVKNVSHYVSGLPGGSGAVREVCELILKSIEEIKC